MAKYVSEGKKGYVEELFYTSFDIEEHRYAVFDMLRGDGELHKAIVDEDDGCMSVFMDYSSILACLESCSTAEDLRSALNPPEHYFSGLEWEELDGYENAALAYEKDALETGISGEPVSLDSWR